MKKIQIAIIGILTFILVLIIYMSAEPVKAAENEIITDGIYEIEVGADSNKTLDIIDASMVSGGNVQIYTKNNGNCQKIKIKYQGDGYYTLTFMHSNMLLDVANAKTDNHTNVWQCRQNGADAQKWQIKDAGNRILQYNLKTRR